MASPAQILANRENAKASTGPKSPEGKAASARNATTHGLSAAFAVLAHEDQADFNELLEDLIAEHRPATQHQRFLTEQLAKSWWLLCRAQRLEAKAFNFLAQLDPQPNPDDPDSLIIHNMFKSNPTGAFATLQRYVTQSERSYHKTWRELKAAKQIQNEADYITGLSSVAHRVVRSPLPGHPALTPEPAGAQYGFIPQHANEANQIRQAAREGALCY